MGKKWRHMYIRNFELTSSSLLFKSAVQVTKTRQRNLQLAKLAKNGQGTSARFLYPVSMMLMLMIVHAIKLNLEHQLT